jgi:tight adherence protein B
MIRPDRLARTRLLHWLKSAAAVSATLLVFLLMLPAAPALRQMLVRSPALAPSLTVALFVFSALLLGTMWLERRVLEGAWRARTARTTGLPTIAFGRDAGRQRAHRQDFLEWLLGPLLRAREGRRLTADWIDAGYGTKGSRYLLLVLAASAAGAGLGLRIAGPVLALATAAIAPLVLIRSVRARAIAARRRMEQQLPQALDAVAAALAAGLSLPQAIRFAARDLPEPVSQVMVWLDLRLRLGRPIEHVLTEVVQAFPEPSLALALDGVAIQRAFGGNLVAMMHQTAALLRERADIELEVQAATSQGKLSGWIVAALVPVSAAILLFTNPRYIDVLFRTLIGQALLVAAIGLQLAGWLAISRLVRVRY